MAAISGGELSAGGKAVVSAATADDPRPLWIAIWGGANTLAEALVHMRDEYTPEELARIVAKLRVYSISDQDDAGPWIRKAFPTLFYIVSPTPPNGEAYAYATWTGIAGDLYYRNGMGADGTTISNEWLQTHIRSKGPLGALYPKYLFIMEGDTPSFLNLIANGLEAHRHPSWGGWGGRYVYRTPYGEDRAIWTQGGDLFGRVTSQDTVTGVDGRTYTSDHATIWRWRNAFQHDFAARMDWTVAETANHPPQIVVNGDASSSTLTYSVPAGAQLRLDARGTQDPDGDRLTFRWFHYPEAGFMPGGAMAEIIVDDATSSLATIHARAACRAMWLPGFVPCSGQGVAHVILAVTDKGEPPLTRYRRVILYVQDVESPG